MQFQLIYVVVVCHVQPNCTSFISTPQRPCRNLCETFFIPKMKKLLVSHSSLIICNKAIDQSKRYINLTFLNCIYLSFLDIDICRQDSIFYFADGGMIPIEDGFGDDMPVSKNGPPDFSNLYVRTHFPETWLWIDTEMRYKLEANGNQFAFAFFFCRLQQHSAPELKNTALKCSIIYILLPPRGHK